jgi:SAM-dependent methyltransferase
VTGTGGRAPGTAGYAENADALAEQYESITFEEIYGPLALLIPPPGSAMDIGAGTGRDAVALAAKGYQVVAVEPTKELRAHGQRLHPHSAIIWCDDTLPDLARVHATGKRFDLVLMTAVWMHLDPEEQERALPRIASLLNPAGRLLMSVRKGPVPPGRRMYPVPIGGLIAHAARLGLSLLQTCDTGDRLGRSDVSWTLLAFEKENRV